MTTVETAQVILDSICDIRPQYKGRRVVAVESVTEENGALIVPYVVLRLDDNSTVKFTGLYAKVILAAKEREG